MTAPLTDRELEEIIDTEEVVKRLSMRLTELKSRCRDFGSFCTDNFVCTVSIQVSQRIASLEEVKAVIGMDVLEVNDLVRLTTSKIVKITQKPNVII